MKIYEGGREKLEQDAAGIIVHELSEALELQDQVILALVGGRSVSGIYTLLAESPLSWDKIHILLADERVNSSDTNYKNIFSSLVSKIDIPEENVHPFETLEKYQDLLQGLGGIHMLVLSAGEDGHVASIFPNHPSSQSDAEGYISVEDAPKEPSERISLALSSIAKAKSSILLFFGEDKREAWEKFKKEKLSTRELPAKIVKDIPNSYVFSDL